MANKHAKRRKELKVIVAFIVVFIIVLIAIIINVNKKDAQPTSTEDESYVQEMDDGISINKSTKLNEAKFVNGISNIQLTEKDGMTTLLADVTNKTEQKTELKKLKIVLLDESGNEIATMTAFINAINAGETTQLNASTTSNYIKAYDFKVVEE